MINCDKTYIAKKIREARKKNGLTQEELAERADIGTKQISRIEIGQFYPSLITFFRIADILNLDLSDFVTQKPTEKSKIRNKLLDIIYNATEEELGFYDRLITFANDERADFKKNLLMKRIYQI